MGNRGDGILILNRQIAIRAPKLKRSVKHNKRLNRLQHPEANLLLLQIIHIKMPGKEPLKEKHQQITVTNLVHPKIPASRNLRIIMRIFPSFVELIPNKPSSLPLLIVLLLSYQII